MKKTSIIASAASLLMLVSAALAPAFVAAQTSGTNTPPAATGSTKADLKIDFHLENPLGKDNATLEQFIANVLDAVVYLLSPVVVIMMLYSGMLFVLARGAPEEIGKAKQSLLYTMIGAAIVLGAKGLAMVIENTIACVAGANC